MSSKFAMNDILIILPGITGSILTKHGNPIWGPVPQSIIGYIESVLGSSGARFFDALRISNDDPNADSLGDGIEATGLVPYTFVPGLDCFDGYSGLRNRLCHTFDLRIGEVNHEDSPAANYVEFPYQAAEIRPL